MSREQRRYQRDERAAKEDRTGPHRDREARGKIIIRNSKESRKKNDLF